MGRYIVGKKETGFFKKNTKWDWYDALEAVQDGDIIELEEGYCPKNFQNNKSIIISKNITIKGTLANNDDSSSAYSNVIDGVCVSNYTRSYCRKRSREI